MERPGSESMRRTITVLHSQIDVVSWEQVTERVLGLAAQHASAYVCACNVHSVVSAWRSQDFQAVINGADVALPDGAPIAWAMRNLGAPQQARISGPDLMWQVCKRSADLGLRVFLYGSTQATLERLRSRLSEEFHSIQIADYHSPPFRPLSDEEDENVVSSLDFHAPGLA